MRHVHPTAALAVLALVLVAAAGATAGGGSRSAHTDRAGDNASAPDIRKVILTSRGNGTVDFEIDLAATIPANGSSVGVMIDADRNLHTGSPMGSEYLVLAEADGASFAKWDGDEWSDFAHRPFRPNLVGGRLTFSLTLSDLRTTRFDFLVGGRHGKDVDLAPDFGTFAYPAAPAKAVIVVST